MCTNLLINESELTRPHNIVQELSVVVSVVIWTIRLSVIGRRNGRHFMTINGIVTEEILHFRCHLKS